MGRSVCVCVGGALGAGLNGQGEMTQWDSGRILPAGLGCVIWDGQGCLWKEGCSWVLAEWDVYSRCLKGVKGCSRDE